MLFLDVLRFSDYAGPDAHSRLPRTPVLPSHLTNVVGTLNLGQGGMETMSYPTIRDNGDFRALERRPLEDMLPAPNAFEAVRLAAQRYPDTIALKLLQSGDPLSTPIEISYREFLARSTQTANLFHDLGLRPGAAVSFLLPLCAEAYYTIMGGDAAGIVNAVNPMLEDWQIARILEAADSRILVTSAPDHNEEIWRKVQQVRARLPNLETIITVGGGNPNDGTIAMEDRLGDYPRDQLSSGREIAPDDIAAYFHTGGTTGTPKLAPHTHRMQASQVWSTGVGLGFGPKTCQPSGFRCSTSAARSFLAWYR